jgi:MoxR-like ATPase
MALENVRDKMNDIRQGLCKVIFGQDEIVDQLLTCFLAGGHVLLEGIPGLGKTLLARCLAKLVDARYKRIQFTPDLLPSDIIGTAIFNAQTASFSFHRGPIFTEILLADEINRTPPKSQAALLEAMEERQVTVSGIKKPLPDLFFVMGTQNPIEYEGTYPLPETQLDRFMMKIEVRYPAAKDELAIIRNYAQGIELQNVERLVPAPVVSKEEILTCRGELLQITIREEVLDYMQKIVSETRDPAYVQLGASPRAAVAMLKGARALAAIRGMEFVTPEEVKDVAVPILRHRIILKPEALIDGLNSDQYLDHLLRRIPVPR